MRITDGEAEIRKERMLLTAYRLFCECGIDHVSIAQIAKASEVSPNSVYRYFDSKAMLVEQAQQILWEQIVEYILESHQGRLAQAQNGLEEIEIRLHGFVDLYRNHKDYVLFAYDYKAFLIRQKIQLPSQAFYQSIGHVREIFLAALKRGQRDGSIAARHSPDLCFIFFWEILRNFVENMVVHDRIYKENHSLEKVLTNIIESIITDLRRENY